MAGKRKESARAERWGVIGGIIATIAAVPFVADLRIAGISALGVGLGTGAAFLAGLGLGRVAASLFRAG